MIDKDFEAFLVEQILLQVDVGDHMLVSQPLRNLGQYLVVDRTVLQLKYVEFVIRFENVMNDLGALPGNHAIFKLKRCQET
jgi:hypothetical protein